MEAATIPAPSGDDAREVGGLSEAEAARRLAHHGPNEIARRAPTPAYRRVLAQLQSPLVVILLGAALLSVFVGAAADAVVIAVIVAINAMIGYFQEARAEQALFALRSLTAARAVVLREGVPRMLPAREVVPGDLLVLAPGDVVAADAELVESALLTTVEAALTGESMPVEKRVGGEDEGRPIAERHGTVFMGTTVATGSAQARAVATGMSTELGRIAHLLAMAEDDQTPLQRRLAALGTVLLVTTVALVGVVALLGWLRGLAWYEILMTSVSLAVSAVPEGLPAVVTVAMAIGVRRLSVHDVLVRRLSAVEALGCATVICTDKTGTLTTGVMTLRECASAEPTALLRAAAACCDAELGIKGGAGVGDPTELAILHAARESGIERSEIEREDPRVRTVPFDTDRRMMLVWRRSGRVFVKGAFESVAAACRDLPEDAHASAEALARRGLRVLAVALGEDGDERQLTFLGLLGLADAPRAEALAAVAAAQAAGVRVVMITGDHALTATAIAAELGIVGPGRPPELSVFARKTAADKTQIVGDLRARGEIVAMTGDGVNDAPSIREADVGIAMGRDATEVTREAADMILTNDDLGGVVRAIREGRIVFDNIRKTTVYLLSGNAAGLIVMLFAAAVGWPLPLLPLHLLWLNVMCEPLPGLALAADPPDEDVMRRPPRPPRSPLIDGASIRHIMWVATLHAVVCLAAFAWGLEHHDVATARTLAFATLVFGVLLRAFAARSPDKVLWAVGWSRNRSLVAVVGVSVALQLLLHAVPLFREWFDLAPLSAEQLALVFAAGFLPVTTVELTKIARRRIVR